MISKLTYLVYKSYLMSGNMFVLGFLDSLPSNSFTDGIREGVFKAVKQLESTDKWSDWSKVMKQNVNDLTVMFGQFKR